MDQETDPMRTHPGSAVRMAGDDRGSYDGNKPPREIEEDIARTRVRMSAAIEALELELTPHRVIENSAKTLRDALEPPPGSFRDQARAYAIPLALIAAGLGWLFMLRRHNWRAGVPVVAGELPVDAVETGGTLAPAYANVVEPVEPLSVVDERTAI